MTVQSSFQHRPRPTFRATPRPRSSPGFDQVSEPFLQPAMDIGSEADKRRSSFITYLGQWFRGRQTPETIPVPPPNDP